MLQIDLQQHPCRLGGLKNRFQVIFLSAIEAVRWFPGNSISPSYFLEDVWNMILSGSFRSLVLVSTLPRRTYTWLSHALHICNRMQKFSLELNSTLAYKLRSVLVGSSQYPSDVTWKSRTPLPMQRIKVIQMNWQALIGDQWNVKFCSSKTLIGLVWPETLDRISSDCC
jgi:hypothetical protein